MAKKKVTPKKSAPAPEEQKPKISSLMASQLATTNRYRLKGTEARRTKAAAVKPVAGLSPEEDVIRVGFKIPLVMQYVLDCPVFPLGVIIELDGPPESHKTMLLYEMGRWFSRQTGVLNMTVTESKVSEELARSIIGWDRASREAFQYLIVPSMNEMQANVLRAINAALDSYQGKADKNYVGANSPVLVGVDSIMGANMEERKQKIMSDGFAGKGFAVAALSLTDYLKEVAALVASQPISVVLINHRKEAPPDPSNPHARVEARKPGGHHVRYQQSFEVITRVKNAWKEADPNPLGAGEIHWRRISLQNGKNSAGTNKQAFTVDVSWRKREIGGRLRQITVFHWEAALPRLIVDFQTNKLYGTKTEDDSEASVSRLAIADRFIHLRYERGKYWSKTLGMDKTDAVSATQMGKMLESNPDCVGSIQALLGIPEGTAWAGGSDYRQAWVDARRKSRERLKTQLDQQEQELQALYDEIQMEDV